MESKIRVTVQFEGEEARVFREVRKKLGYKRDQSAAVHMLHKALDAECDLYNIRR